MKKKLSRLEDIKHAFMGTTILVFNKALCRRRALLSTYMQNLNTYKHYLKQYSTLFLYI